ncbi:MAG TPA: mechanosensitive ion channel domain-containing protein [Candidatus Nanoarchaeia archaeon]|nr:mechanosensitive ion channel domain-containing protein [Candidatus Nanoarchaeia archaeon]
MPAKIIELAQKYFYTIAAGIGILLIGLALGVLVKKLIYKILKEIELNKIMSHVGVTYNLEQWVSSILSYLVYLITIVFFLDQLGITSIVLYLILGAVLMLVILTVIVGLKDVMPNFVAWILLQRKDRMIEGHQVNVKEIYGKVEKIGFLETEIRTDSGDLLYVPNSLFLKSKFWVKE